MATLWCEIPRDVLMVEGRDALTFLHSQVSQDLQSLAVGQAAATLVLDPTGKVVVLARVLRGTDTTFVIDTDTGYGEVLRARLERFRIRVDVRISPLPWRCLALRSTDGRAVTGTVPDSADGGVAVPAWWGDGTAVDLLGPDPVAPVGAVAGTAADVEAQRIRAGWPAMGHEIVPGDTIPASLGDVVGAAVSFTKGCYPGQELVERMDSRGASAPRRLRTVTVADGTRPGDPFLEDGVEVGTVTSVSGSAALAFVRRATPG